MEWGTMKRLRMMGAAVVVATLSVLGLAAPAAASDAGPYHRLQFAHAFKCVTTNGTAYEAQVMQWNCDGFANGTWTFRWTGGGTAEIYNPALGMCLVAYGTVQNSPVWQSHCSTASDYGLWTGLKVGGVKGADGVWRDYYLLKNEATGLCMNSQGANNNNGSGIIMWTCSGFGNSPNNMKLTWY